MIFSTKTYKVTLVITGKAFSHIIDLYCSLTIILLDIYNKYLTSTVRQGYFLFFLSLKQQF